MECKQKRLQQQHLHQQGCPGLLRNRYTCCKWSGPKPMEQGTRSLPRKDKPKESAWKPDKSKGEECVCCNKNCWKLDNASTWCWANRFARSNVRVLKTVGGCKMSLFVLEVRTSYRFGDIMRKTQMYTFNQPSMFSILHLRFTTR